MKVTLQQFLNSQSKTKYWLAKQTGLSNSSIIRLCNNDTKSITFTSIDKICTCLNCSPSDFLSPEIIEDLKKD